MSTFSDPEFMAGLEKMLVSSQRNTASVGQLDGTYARTSIPPPPHHTHTHTHTHKNGIHILYFWDWFVLQKPNITQYVV